MAWQRTVSQVGRISVTTLQLLCLVHIINQNLFEVRMCKGASMLPTLSPSGDLVLHARLPFLRFLSTLPFAGEDLRSRFPTNIRGLPSSKRDPSAGMGLQLGDIVVAISPADPSRTICKRVLGLPGDTVLVDPREGHANDELAIAHHDVNPAVSTLMRMHSARTVTVPPGHVWLAGDNLANSTDSRHYGPVPLALVKGRVMARLYPHPQWMPPALHKLSSIPVTNLA